MKLARVIIILSAAQTSAQVCMSKTNEEMMQDIRATVGCPNAKPTSCPCTGNLQVQYDCPAPNVTLWASAGKKCVKADSDMDSTWAKHPNKWDYPAETGKDCSKINIEPGSYDCTKVLIPGSNPKKYKPHQFKNPFAGYNSNYDSEAWCTQKSCYVDPCKCNMKDMSSSSWFKTQNGSTMYYSGMKCGAPYEFKAKLCKGKTTKDTCLQDAGCKWSPQPVCRSKTEDEMMRDLRTKLKCPDAQPTDCNCTGNLQPQYDCPAPNVTLWASTGKKCVKADSDKDSTWAKHPNKWDYPAETGKDCSKINIEPGSYDCTKVLIPGSNPKKYKPHQFKNPFSGYNSNYDSEAWCTQKSCYVDPCKCNMRDISSSSWFKKPDGSTMYYSGVKCGGTFEFKAALCSGKATKDTCNVDAGCIWEAGGSSTSGKASTSGGRQAFKLSALSFVMGLALL